jgi:enoyl-CoA hydratase/carnithine racemase
MRAGGEQELRMAEGLRVTLAEDVCVAVLDNPSRLNALGTDVLTRLKDLCERVDGDRDVRVLVLTGEGRAFCAGADIASLAGLEALAEAQEYIGLIADVYGSLERLSKPVIAAVNGPALGGGLELCLACDIIIASTAASFACPEVLLGAMPGFAAVRLPALLGRHRAAEMMMLGEPISAEDALRIGLVNRVVPPNRVVEEALDVAHRLASGAPLALRAIRIAMRGSSTSADMTLFTTTASSILATQDAKDGMQAFLRKEKPRFEGR